MCAWMHFKFVYMTNGVDFSVVKKVISAVIDFRRYFTMSKTDAFS